MPKLLPEYEHQLVDARVKFANLISKLTAKAQPQNLALFLINQCVLGETMMASNQSCTQQAGQQCQQLGYPNIGETLINQAKHQAKHLQLIKKDSHAFINWLNQKYKLNINADKYLKKLANITPSVKKYCALNEVNAHSGTPHCQVAINYEVERLSTVHGFTLVNLCILKLGPSTLKHLSLIRHLTKHNPKQSQSSKHQMQQLLDKCPQLLAKLVATGNATLQAYAEFIEDCFTQANADCEKYFTQKRKVTA